MRRLLAGLLTAGIITGLACGGSESSQGPGPAPACSAGSASHVSLTAGTDTLIDPTLDSGCVTFPAMATAQDSAEYLVVAQSAGGTPGDTASFRLRNATLSSSAAANRLANFLPVSPRYRGPVPRAFDRRMRQLERTRRPAFPAFPSRAAAASARGRAGPLTITRPTVGTLRTFSVCANLDCTTFKPVTGRVASVGAHVAIYVDTLAPANGLGPADLDTLQQVFDTHVYTVDTVAFGGVSDIDSNGVVLVLMTPVVNQSESVAACLASGFVAGFFYPPDLDPATAAQNNDGEIFYTIVADPNGALSCAHTTSDLKLLLPTTFLHELQHVISFNQHVLQRGGQVEDIWLDESLSSLAEELGGRSFLPDTATFSNYVAEVVYDAYQYFANPGNNNLLQVADTILPEFGAGWLYARYLADQFGPGITNQLEATTLTGTANVAFQTGLPFAATASRWALANYVSDLPGFAPPPGVFYRSWSFRATFGSLYQQDPVDFPVPFPLLPPVVSGSGVNVSGVLHSGSGFYVDVHQGPGAAAFTLHLAGPSALLPAEVVPRMSIIRIH